VQIERVIGDFDSLCWQASFGEDKSWEDVRISIQGKLKGIRETVRLPADLVSGFVEHPDLKWNYRHQVAVTLPYKGNRKDKEPPFHLRDAKLFMVEHGLAKWARGVEAEDAAICTAFKHGFDNVAVAAIDKDLKMHPCTFINYGKILPNKTMQLLSVSEGQALTNMYAQFLTGDKTVDNIPGLEGFGPAAAKKALADASPKEMPEIVARCYKDPEFRITFMRGKEAPQGSLSYHYLMEQCRLLYILKEINKPYVFPLSAAEYEKL